MVQKLLSMVVWVAVLAAMGWGTSTAWTELRAEFPYLAAQDQARRWTQGAAPPPTEATWKHVLAELHKSEHIRAENPELQELLGSLYLLASQKNWQPDEQRLAWADIALTHFRQSLQLRPTDGLTWALLGMALADARQPTPLVAQAVQKARQLGPNENHVQQVLLHLAIRHWAAAPAELQNWATDLYEYGNAARRNQINRLAKTYSLEFISETPPR